MYKYSPTFRMHLASVDCLRLNFSSCSCTGSVIKAWDLGVATMKKGELCVLTCKSEYAYGKSGSPPKIPPDATLVFEIELNSWKGEDLTKDKDGGIIRKMLQKGEGFSSPNDEASVEGLFHLMKFVSQCRSRC